MQIVSKVIKNQFLNRIYLLLTLILCVVFFSSCEQNDGFVFLFFGDTQETEGGDNKYTVFSDLIEAAVEIENNPDFLVIAGDVVDDGNDEEQWSSLINILNEKAKGIEYYFAVGNHDDTELQTKYFDLSTRPHISGDNSFYSFDYENTHFTFMDSNLMGAAEQETIDWLENDLKNSEKKYKIAVFHHPPYVAIDNFKDVMRAETILREYIPIMEKYGIDLVLTAHQHVYMRTLPILEGEVTEKNDGIVYLISNSSEKSYTATEKHYTAATYNEGAVYSSISITDDLITVETRNSKNEIIDNFILE